MLSGQQEEKRRLSLMAFKTAGSKELAESHSVRTAEKKDKAESHRFQYSWKKREGSFIKLSGKIHNKRRPITQLSGQQGEEIRLSRIALRTALADSEVHSLSVHVSFRLAVQKAKHRRSALQETDIQ